MEGKINWIRNRDCSHLPRSVLSECDNIHLKVLNTILMQLLESRIELRDLSKNAGAFIGGFLSTGTHASDTFWAKFELHGYFSNDITLCRLHPCYYVRLVLQAAGSIKKAQKVPVILVKASVTTWGGFIWPTVSSGVVLLPCLLPLLIGVL